MRTFSRPKSSCFDATREALQLLACCAATGLARVFACLLEANAKKLAGAMRRLCRRDVKILA